MLDQNLNFSTQVDYAIGKAKRACAKISYIIRGRFGLPVKTAIKLYKALIQPHLEYGVAAWASLKEKDLAKRKCSNSMFKTSNGPEELFVIWCNRSDCWSSSSKD